MIGQTINRLTVIAEAPRLPTRSERRWLCICSCGNRTTVRGTQIKAGIPISCGCALREALRARGRDLTGQTFGRLTVKEKAPNRKCGNTAWLCECRCGSAVIVETGKLTGHRTVSCGCYRAKRSASNSDALSQREKTSKLRAPSVRISRGLGERPVTT